MKIPPNDSKKPLGEIVSNEAVRVSTSKLRSVPNPSVDADILPPGLDEGSDKASSVKLGLAKYLAEELDSDKIKEQRRKKLEDLKARIGDGSYLASINSDHLAAKIVDEIDLESFTAQNTPGEG